MVLTGVTAGGAQEPQPAPTFRTGVDLVAVDVSVVDRRGQPVDDLTAEDFVLTVDGRPRPLVSAEFISLARAEPTRARPAHYSTNADAAVGRLIMLVVDAGNIRRGSGRALLTSAARFIDRLQPSDRVGLAVLPGPGAYVQFTANHDLVKATIAQVSGTASPALSGFYHVGVSEALALEAGDDRIWREVVARECGNEPDEASIASCQNGLESEARTIAGAARQQSRASLAALRALMSRLADSAVPKTIVLLSEGLVVSRDFDDLLWVSQAAAEAQASLYVLRLDSSMFDASSARPTAAVREDRQLQAEGLEYFASAARGAIFNVVAAADAIFERLALELSGHYLLSFEPLPAERDGRPHRIRVEVRRRGADVRARREFRTDAGAVAERRPEDVLAELIRTPIPATDLPVRTATFIYQDPGSSKLRVLIGAEIDQPLADGSLAVGVVLYDERGRAVANEIGWIVPRPDTPADEMASYVGSALLDPGVYTLKLAVTDIDGRRRGSVEHAVRARLTPAGQLRIGDLMLADARPGATGSLRPSVAGELKAPMLVGYTEVYADAPAQLQNLGVVLELAEAENEPAIGSAPGRVQRADGGRRSVVEGVVPVDLLPPGNYVLRAVVSLANRPVATVSRPFVIRRALSAGSAAAGGGAGTRTGPIFADGRHAFQRDRVLQPDVVGHFLDRLQTSAGARLPGAVAGALEHARAGRFDALQAELRRAGDGDLAATFLRGLAHLSRGELEPAAARFRAALKISSDFFPAVFYLGACYAAGGRDREAVGAWQTSLVTEDDAPIIYLMLGDALLRLEEAQHAVDILEEAASLWPEDDDVRLRLGAAYLLAGEDAQALETLEPYLERHPEDHEALFLALRLLYEAGADGRTLRSAGDDAERFDRYARQYAATGGPQRALLEQWRRFMRR